MGMAASQSRFLGLTARKTNVEYRGQQINQARTALANQTSNLYNDMLALRVPTPPIVSDYYSTSYTYEDGDTSCEIISGLGQNNCEIRVSQKQLKNYSQEVNSGYPSTIYYEGGIPYINGNRLTKLSGDSSSSSIATTKLETLLKDGIQLNENAPFVVSNGANKMNILNWEDYQNAQSQGYRFLEDEGNNILYSYTKNGKTSYIQSSYLPAEDDTIHQVVIPQEFYENEFYTYSTKTVQNCTWDTDTSGRYATFSGDFDGKTKSFTLDYNQVDDDEAYDQAMIEYKYKYAQYEKEIEDINAKTKQIQEQDRTLELQLRECDTEQEAISKELDAIKKVIDSNIERVFKTFA